MAITYDTETEFTDEGDDRYTISFAPASGGFAGPDPATLTVGLDDYFDAGEPLAVVEGRPVDLTIDATAGVTAVLSCDSGQFEDEQNADEDEYDYGYSYGRTIDVIPGTPSVTRLDPTETEVCTVSLSGLLHAGRGQRRRHRRDAAAHSGGVTAAITSRTAGRRRPRPTTGVRQGSSWQRLATTGPVRSPSSAAVDRPCSSKKRGTVHPRGLHSTVAEPVLRDDAGRVGPDLGVDPHPARRASTSGCRARASGRHRR